MASNNINNLRGDMKRHNKRGSLAKIAIVLGLLILFSGIVYAEVDLDLKGPFKKALGFFGDNKIADFYDDHTVGVDFFLFFLMFFALAYLGLSKFFDKSNAAKGLAFAVGLSLAFAATKAEITMLKLFKPFVTNFIFIIMGLIIYFILMQLPGLKEHKWGCVLIALILTYMLFNAVNLVLDQDKKIDISKWVGIPNEVQKAKAAKSELQKIQLETSIKETELQTFVKKKVIPSLSDEEKKILPDEYTYDQVSKKGFINLVLNKLKKEEDIETFRTLLADLSELDRLEGYSESKYGELLTELGPTAPDTVKLRLVKASAAYAGVRVKCEASGASVPKKEPGKKYPPILYHFTFRLRDSKNNYYRIEGCHKLPDAKSAECTIPKGKGGQYIVCKAKPVYDGQEGLESESRTSNEIKILEDDFSNVLDLYDKTETTIKAARQPSGDEWPGKKELNLLVNLLSQRKRYKGYPSLVGTELYDTYSGKILDLRRRFEAKQKAYHLYTEAMKDKGASINSKISGIDLALGDIKALYPDDGVCKFLETERDKLKILKVRQGDQTEVVTENIICTKLEGTKNKCQIKAKGKIYSKDAATNVKLSVEHNEINVRPVPTENGFEWSVNQEIEVSGDKTKFRAQVEVKTKAGTTPSQDIEFEVVTAGEAEGANQVEEKGGLYKEGDNTMVYEDDKMSITARDYSMKEPNNLITYHNTKERLLLYVQIHSLEPTTLWVKACTLKGADSRCTGEIEKKIEKITRPYEFRLPLILDHMPSHVKLFVWKKESGSKKLLDPLPTWKMITDPEKYDADTLKAAADIAALKCDALGDC